MPKGFAPILFSLLLLYSAQQMLTPVLAPLSRQLGLGESQLGLVITVAALALTVGSAVWGRLLDHVGARTVLLFGILLAALGLTGFAVVAYAGIAGQASTAVVLGLFLLTRSLLFGFGIAAVPVAALASAAALSEGESARTRLIGFVGAAQGLSLIMGPALGGGLALVSLLLPVYVAPVVVASLGVFVLLRVPRLAQAANRQAAARLSPFDRRIAPLLAIGFLLYLSLSLVQVIIGFLIADRLRLGLTETSGASALALVAAGVVLVITQAVGVPKLGWSPVRLLRTGIPFAIVGYLLLLLAPQLWLIVLSFAVLALGLGLTIPGFTSATTLVIDQSQQGAVAGLISATIGATFVIGPLTSTALYELAPIAPQIAAILAAILALAATWTTPVQRADSDNADGPALT